jgi:hypothetical protein
MAGDLGRFGCRRRPTFCASRWEAHYLREKSKRDAIRRKLARARVTREATR